MSERLNAIRLAPNAIRVEPRVWRDQPCPHHSRMMPNRHCRACDGTGRILEPAE